MTISTRVPLARTPFIQRVNNGMCSVTSRSAALSASTVPLQAPTVSIPTRCQLGTWLTHIS